MTLKLGALGVIWAGAVACSLLASAAAQAKCRDVTVSARGQNLLAIGDAKSSAGEALGAKIVKKYGDRWGAGSHRNGTFRCKQVAPGPRSGWTCTATTSAICATE